MDSVVCGIDPGLGTTGYAVVKGAGVAFELLDAGVCRFPPKDPLPDRLNALFHDVSEILREFRPVLVAVESLYSHYRHPQTAILMGHARGVVLLSAAQCGAVVESYAATRVKRLLTGKGRASKEQVQRAVQTTLGLAEPPEPHDVADAVAIALCGLDDLHARQTTGSMS
ncbi:MAG: crossover junction endodeoxyribonuclease RuvC [Phycisphaerae bacterium]